MHMLLPVRCELSLVPRKATKSRYKVSLLPVTTPCVALNQRTQGRFPPPEEHPSYDQLYPINALRNLALSQVGSWVRVLRPQAGTQMDSIASRGGFPPSTANSPCE